MTPTYAEAYRDDGWKRQRYDPLCDAKLIDWEFFMEIHIPGVMEYESRIAKATRARL